jgi:hypothetical protein
VWQDVPIPVLLKWISGIEEETLISDGTILGTHNSTFITILDTASTQFLTVADQLKLRIR